MSLFTKEVFFEKRRKKEKKEERLWNIEKLLHKYKPIRLNVTLLCNELNLKRFISVTDSYNKSISDRKSFWIEKNGPQFFFLVTRCKSFSGGS